MNPFRKLPRRRPRCTQAWNRPRHSTRWWQEDVPAGPRNGTKACRLAWSAADLWDIPKAARNIIIGLSLLVPLSMLAMSKRVRERWERINPDITVQRLALTGKATVKDVSNLLKACKASPDNPKILRAFATAVFESDPAEARQCYHKIQQLNACTPSDHAAHARLLARLQDLAGARAVIAKIPRLAQESADVQRAWLAIHQESRDFAAADRTLEKLEELTPDDSATFLTTAISAVQAKASPEILVSLERRALGTILHGLSSGTVRDPSFASKVISLSLKDATNRAQAAEILRHLPGIGAENRMAAVRLEHPSDLSGPVHDMLCNAYRQELMSIGGLSGPEKDRVAKYLQKEDEHALVVEIIGLQESFTERPLFERRMDSLLHLGKWRDAAEVLAASKPPQIPQSRCLFDALKALRHATSGHPVADSVLPTALEEAIDARRPVACYAVGCMALDYKMKILASDAFAAAAELSEGDAQIVDGIISSSRSGGLSATDVLQAISRHASPTNHEVQERLCYLRLLSHQDVAATRTYISARLRQNPGAPYLKMLDALQQHLAGEFVQSAQAIIPLPSHRWRHGEAGTLAAIMAAAGKFEQSSALLGHLDVKQLFPEEVTMIKPWHAKMEMDKSLLGVTRPADKPVF